VIYRLFLFSGFLLVAQAVLRRSLLNAGLLFVAAFLTQTVNVFINVPLPIFAPANAAIFAYDALRYVVPGVVWAWIYARQGFVSAEIASVGCHIFLQPMYSQMF
jgi:hypothetical protein